MKKIFVILLFSVFFKTYAEEVTVTPTVATDVTPSRVTLPASGVFVTTFESNLRDDYDKKRDLSFEFIGSLKLSELVTLSKYIGASKSVVGDRQLGIQNGYLGANFLFYQNKGHQLRTSTRVYIPYSKESREDQGFRTRIYLKPSGKLDFDFISLTFGPGISRYFFAYKYDNNGNPNPAYAITPALEIEFRLGEKFALSAYFQNAHRWDHNNQSLDDVFEHGQELSFTTSDLISMAIGHSIGRGTFLENTSESNLSFFDSEDSTIYSSLTLSF